MLFRSAGKTPEASFNFTNIVNRDIFYARLKEMGITAIPCVQGTSYQFLDEDEVWDTIKNSIPVERGADTLDPASYALHGNFMYNLAARYGQNSAIDPATLNSTDSVVGLNLLTVIESWNEQNKNWEGKQSYFTPYEYAAMLSADLAGHEGKIPNAGVKTADPTLRLSMGGTVGAGAEWTHDLDLMKHDR